MAVADRRFQKNKFKYNQHCALLHPMRQGFFHAQPGAVPA